jgi:cell fate regulator YaaT (PSP1 superfamily)
MPERNDTDRAKPAQRRDGSQEPATGAAAGSVSPADADGPVVLVRFHEQRKSCYHNRYGVALQIGRYCLVEADRGRDLGQVVYMGSGLPAWRQEAGRQGVLALATAQDLLRLPELRREERDAWSICQQRIEQHGLPMHLAGVERRWDRKKLTFYFLAAGRIDFRALVRDLAGIFRTRIELRQIGVRDEARLKGGLGICGRVFCCSSFLGAFESVGLRMAKDQQLALNQSKLSGPCGRLRCCLAYEHQTYQEELKRMPKLGSVVTWRDRKGKVRKIDPLQNKVTLQFADDGHEMVEVAAAELCFSAPAAEPDAEQEAGNDHDAGNRVPRPRRRRGRRRPVPPPGTPPGTPRMP